MLYVRLSKALCGLLQYALLCYKKLRTELEDFGFEVIRTTRALQIK